MSAERQRLQARQALRERKADEAYQEWLRQLRDEAYVELASRSAKRALPSIALTSGEPAGIGPELCVRSSRSESLPARLVAIGDRALARRLPAHRACPAPAAGGRGHASIARNAPLRARASSTARSRGCLAGEFDAMVTAPVQKSIDQRRRHRLSPATPIPGRAARTPQRGDDAGRRRPARRARDHAPAARRRAGAPSRATAGSRRCASSTPTCASVRHRAAAHPGRRAQSARRRSRHLGREEIE